MNRRITSILVLISMVFLLLAGCTNTKNESSKAGENKEAQQPLVITDQAGRKVEIPDKVERIVSSYYITSSLLIALDAKDKVVGLEIQADTREIYKKAAPEFLNLPAVGSGKTFNVEECMKLKPDLVILPSRLKEFVQNLETLKIPVIVVSPESMESFIECVDILGKAIGKEERAKKLISYYNDNINMVKNATKDIKIKPKVYLSGGKSPLTTCTSKMYQNDLIEMAGGENVSKPLTDGYWANVSIEEIIKWNPDNMYIVEYASYDINQVFEDKRFGNINAVKSHKVFTFPSKLEPWDYPTPSSVLGILWLANNLHPEIYSTDKYKKDAREFYKTFFDIEVTDSDMGL